MPTAKQHSPARMSPLRFIFWLRCSMEILLPLSLLLFAAVHGMQSLENWHGPAGSISNELYIPAVMMNAGKGFTSVAPGEIPGLQAFINFETPAFDPMEIPPSLETLPADPYQSFHRYLIYSVALAWKIGGINWDAVKALLVVLLCITVAIVYLICRTTMHALLSFPAALGFLYAPPVLMTLPLLRDFAKAPFILMTLLLLAITVKRRLSGVQYFLLSALLGLCLGIGMGFRRELLIFLPISLIFVAVCRLKMSFVKNLVYRATALTLVVLIFGLSALPIHRALAGHGYLAAHDTIMGFAADSDREIGLLASASYVKHYLYNDLFATMVAHEAAERGISRNIPYDAHDDLDIKRDYVSMLVKTFPADVLVRAYASVLRMASGAFPTRNAWFLLIENRGLWFMAAALLLLAARHPFRAWQVVFLLCCFCGYSSLQFGLRHVFHMSFTSYFFAGMSVQLAMDYGQSIRDRLKDENHEALFRRCRRAIRRATLWSMVTLLIFALPLAAARRAQHDAVLRMADAALQAPAREVAHEMRQWENRTIISPKLGASCRPCLPHFSIDAVHHRALIAQFTEVSEPVDLFIIYEWEQLPWDFSGRITMSWQGMDRPADVAVVIPIHEATVCGDTSAFAGMAMSENLASHFAGFKEVEDLDHFPLLIPMAIPDDFEDLKTHQSLILPWHGYPWQAGFRPYFLFDMTDPNEQVMPIRADLTQDRAKNALALARSVLEQRPDSLQFSFLLAEALALNGEMGAAEDLLQRLMGKYPDNFMFYACLDHFWRKYTDPPQRLQRWTALGELYPGHCLIEKYRNLTAIELEM